METIFTERHNLRNSKTELFGGQLVEPFERPSRAEDIINRVREVGLGPISEPLDFGLAPILAVHDAGFIDFLQIAWRDWQAADFKGEAMPTVWPARRMSQRIPTDIEGRLGYYALSCETSISDGTWEAAYASAQVALTGASRISQGARAVFSLCRPPRPSCCNRHVWRVLLCKQRSRRRTAFARHGGQTRCDPRCRFSPWQWHARYL